MTRGWLRVAAAGAGMLVSMAVPLAAQVVRDTGAVHLLWSKGAPGALGHSAADRPSITVYLPPADRANGTAVVIFPGGGYRNVVMGKEGVQPALWLNSLGVAAFVVRYRLGPRYQHPVMLWDAQRAIRTVRARASEWRVDPQRIGVMGFSAGGHLAATTGTHFVASKSGTRDPVDAVSSRPDFMILVYPVITMRDPFVHRGSRENLLGTQPDPKLVELLSSESQVTAKTPPVFLVASSDDSSVPVENTVLFYQALRNAGVPAEMHVYQTGRHGFGLAPNDSILASWLDRAKDWLRLNRWLPEAP